MVRIAFSLVVDLVESAGGDRGRLLKGESGRNEFGLDVVGGIGRVGGVESGFGGEVVVEVVESVVLVVREEDGVVREVSWLVVVLFW